MWMNPEDITLGWDNPGTERQIPHDLLHSWTLKKVDYIQVESRMLVTSGYRKRVDGEGTGERLVDG